MGNKFYYCQNAVECKDQCYNQCKHCKIYYAPLELENRRVPRKLKKKLSRQVLNNK